MFDFIIKILYFDTWIISTSLDKLIFLINYILIIVY